MDDRLEAWLMAAIADAQRRGLPELQPLLEGLARSTAGLRAADAEHTAAPDEAPPSDERSRP
jgi:hypothetical protein